MTKFNETAAGSAFIATAASRKTSVEIMSAIAFFARDAAEAQAIWDGSAIGKSCTMLDIWENATNNGRIDADELCWGAAGSQWFAEAA